MLSKQLKPFTTVLSHNAAITTLFEKPGNLRPGGFIIFNIQKSDGDPLLIVVHDLLPGAHAASET
jgi:hypothetical protein